MYEKIDGFSTKNIPKYTVLLGILTLILSFIIPGDSFQSMKPMGYATIYICPFLGIIGLIF